MNTAHIHNHIVMNSVSFENGQKFHQSAKEMEQAKRFSNELCLQYGLSITETKADRKRIPEWKWNLRKKIKDAMEMSRTREDFIDLMSSPKVLKSIETPEIRSFSFPKSCFRKPIVLPPLTNTNHLLLPEQ